MRRQQRSWQRGQAMIEYALILAAVVAVIIAAVAGPVKGAINGMFQKSSDRIQNAAGKF